MPRNFRYSKGFIDPLSLIAVVFLVLTIVVGTAVTTNKNITLNPNKEAATISCSGICRDNCNDDETGQGTTGCTNGICCIKNPNTSTIVPGHPDCTSPNSCVVADKCPDGSLSQTGNCTQAGSICCGPRISTDTVANTSTLTSDQVDVTSCKGTCDGNEIGTPSCSSITTPVKCGCDKSRNLGYPTWIALADCQQGQTCDNGICSGSITQATPQPTTNNSSTASIPQSTTASDQQSTNNSSTTSDNTTTIQDIVAEKKDCEISGGVWNSTTKNCDNLPTGGKATSCTATLLNKSACGTNGCAANQVLETWKTATCGIKTFCATVGDCQSTTSSNSTTTNNDSSTPISQPTAQPTTNSTSKTSLEPYCSDIMYADCVNGCIPDLAGGTCRQVTITCADTNKDCSSKSCCNSNDACQSVYGGKFCITKSKDACSVGQTKCTLEFAGKSYKYTCDSNGYYQKTDTCDAGCNGNNCASACVAGQTKCNGNSLQTCNSSGNAWVEQSCSGGCYKNTSSDTFMCKGENGSVCQSDSDCQSGYCANNDEVSTIALMNRYNFSNSTIGEKTCISKSDKKLVDTTSNIIKTEATITLSFVPYVGPALQIYGSANNIQNAVYTCSQISQASADPRVSQNYLNSLKASCTENIASATLNLIGAVTMGGIQSGLGIFGSKTSQIVASGVLTTGQGFNTFLSYKEAKTACAIDQNSPECLNGKLNTIISGASTIYGGYSLGKAIISDNSIYPTKITNETVTPPSEMEYYPLAGSSDEVVNYTNSIFSDNEAYRPQSSGDIYYKPSNVTEMNGYPLGSSSDEVISYSNKYDELSGTKIDTENTSKQIAGVPSTTNTTENGSVAEPEITNGSRITTENEAPTNPETTTKPTTVAEKVSNWISEHVTQPLSDRLFGKSPSETGTTTEQNNTPGEQGQTNNTETTTKPTLINKFVNWWYEKVTYPTSKLIYGNGEKTNTMEVPVENESNTESGNKTATEPVTTNESGTTNTETTTKPTTVAEKVINALNKAKNQVNEFFNIKPVGETTSPTNEQKTGTNETGNSNQETNNTTTNLTTAQRITNWWDEHVTKPVSNLISGKTTTSSEVIDEPLEDLGGSVDTSSTENYEPVNEILPATEPETTHNETTTTTNVTPHFTKSIYDRWMLKGKSPFTITETGYENVMTDNLNYLTWKANKVKGMSFDPTKIEVLDIQNVSDRYILEIRLPTGDSVLVYRSTGTGTPGLKEAGEWFVINGFTDVPEGEFPHGWFIKDDESINLTKGGNSYLTELAGYLQTNGPDNLIKVSGSTGYGKASFVETYIRDSDGTWFPWIKNITNKYIITP